MQGFRDLKMYGLAYQPAMQIFNETKLLPKDERYSLSDQSRRSSRSVVASIAEGFRKRQHPKMFLTNWPTPTTRPLRRKSGWISRGIADISPQNAILRSGKDMKRSARCLVQ